jgi:hypothetical protein
MWSRCKIEMENSIVSLASSIHRAGAALEQDGAGTPTREQSKKAYLVRVHDHHVIADIGVRPKCRLMFPLQNWSDCGCQPPYRLIGGIDEVPCPLYCSSGKAHGVASSRWEDSLSLKIV